MRQDTLRNSITYLFTFFISFFLFTLVLASAIRFTIMDQGFFLRSMDEVSYYENTATELNKIIKQQARAAGFEVENFQQFIKEEDIREAMITYEKQMINGDMTSIDASEFKVKLEKKIETIMDENQIYANTSVEKALEQFVNECVKNYIYLTQFPYIDVYGQLIHLYQKIYIFMTPILTSLLIGLVYFVHRIQKSKRRRKKYYAIACIGSGLLCGIAPAVLYATRYFEKINLSPQYMYELLVVFTNTLLILLMMSGLVLILVGLMIAYVKLKTKNKKRKTERVYPSNEMFAALKRESA